MGIGGADSAARRRRGETKAKGKSECDAWVRRREAKRVSKTAAVWGVCGGVLAGSGSGGGGGVAWVAKGKVEILTF